MNATRDILFHPTNLLVLFLLLVYKDIFILTSYHNV